MQYDGWVSKVERSCHEEGFATGSRETRRREEMNRKRDGENWERECGDE